MKREVFSTAQKRSSQGRNKDEKGGREEWRRKLEEMSKFIKAHECNVLTKYDRSEFK